MRLGWMEIALIVLLVVVLFGHNKFPGMMKNLAEGLNVFKKEIKDMCKLRLAQYSQPKEIEFRKTLPTTLYKKVDYRKLEKEESEKNEKTK